MKKVSVIVPVYNVENYLKRCLNTLVNQTLKDIEIILVNDASTDNSLSIMKEYQEKYPEIVKVIDSKVNSKQGGARNLGLEVATGEYIGFVDSDDWVHIEMFEKLYLKAKSDRADIVDADYFTASGIDNCMSVEKSNLISELGELDEEKKKRLILNTGRMWTKIFKSKLLKDNNIKFPENVFYEDNQFMPLVMVYAETISKIDEPLYYYFIDNSQSTSKKQNSYHHFDRLITAQNMVNDFKERELFAKYKDELTYKFIELYYVNTIVLCLTKFKPIEVEKLQEIRSYIKKEYPHYKENKYYKASRYYSKVLCTLNDFNPSILAFLYKIVSSLISLQSIKKLVLKKQG